MDIKKNILIIGKNSYIAKSLRIDKKFYLNFNLSYTSSNKYSTDKNTFFLDLSKPISFDFSLIENIDYVLFIAAISSPDFCEKYFQKAYQINVKGTSFVIKNLLDMGKKVIFFSSDTVYGNREEVVNELSNPNPIGNYGRMKLEVEENFSNHINFKALRLSYIFSKDDKFTKYLHDCSKNRKVCEIFHPIHRKVIYIKDVKDAIFTILNRWEKITYNVINIVGNKLISKKDMADYYKRIVNSNLSYKIVEPKKEFFKARPRIINVKSLYLKEILNRDPTDIKIAMEKEFQNINQED